jgi:hypothetical protein
MDFHIELEAKGVPFDADPCKEFLEDEADNTRASVTYDLVFMENLWTHLYG